MVNPARKVELYNGEKMGQRVAGFKFGASKDFSQQNLLQKSTLPFVIFIHNISSCERLHLTFTFEK